MQNSQDSKDIVKRFHEALQRLIDDKKIRGKQTFCTKYDIDKRALYYSSRDYRVGAFEIGWLKYLVEDYLVSPGWLITGAGKFYSEPKKEKKSCANFVHPDILIP